MADSTRSDTRYRLGIQLGVPFVIFVAITIVILSFLTIVSFRGDQSEARQAIRLNTDIISRTLSSSLIATGDDLRLASKSVNSFQQISIDSQTLIRNILRSNPTILELSFFDVRGNPSLHVTQPTVSNATMYGTPVPDAPFFEQGIRGTEYLDDPYLSDYQIPFVSWSFPVRDVQDRVIGVMRATVDLSSLWGSIAAFSSQQDGEAYIVDGEGTLLVRNALADVQRNRSLAELGAVKTFLGGESVITEYIGLDGQKVLGFWSVIPPSNWGVIVELPLSSVFGNAYRNLALFLVLIVVLICVIVYQVLLFRRYLLQPLALFREGVEKFGAGEFDHRIMLKVHNELYDLARTFNEMAESISRNTNMIVERMKQVLKEQTTAGKLLVRRDIELTSANERLRELDKIKTEFVSVAAHQLRTPLSGIKWVLKMIMDGDVGPVSKEQYESLDKAYTSNERMITLVNDMLNVDRIDAGRSKYTFIPTRITDIIDRTLTNFTERIAGKHINFVREVPDNLPQIMADPDKLSEVVKNLIDNAVKYIMDGGTITLRATRTDTEIELSIIDTGIGIPKDQQADIFGRFFRGRNAIHMVTDGSGLGLYIAKNIIERHGGRLWFESTEGVGTEFHLTLKIMQQHE